MLQTDQWLRLYTSSSKLRISVALDTNANSYLILVEKNNHTDVVSLVSHIMRILSIAGEPQHFVLVYPPKHLIINLNTL